MSEKRSKFKKQGFSVEDVSSSSSCSSSSFSSEDEEDNSKQLKPIKDYLNNRTELAHQLFKSVKLDKIKMMLPQSLKKVNLKELEDLCANELSGMSKRRILSTLNGNTLTSSSDTDESDNSGPSLEIISDTEEWISDTEVQVKKENDPTALSKPNKLKKKTKVKHKEKKNDQSKVITKEKRDKNPKNDIQKPVKSEKSDVDDKKSQEGESLLDLLELEMRARAIRALIRKEEDIIPNLPNSDEKSSSSTGNVDTNDKNKVNKVRYEEKLIVKTLNNDKKEEEEEEDVVFVTKPTPTICVLSSDDDYNNDDDDGSENKNKSKNNKTDNNGIGNKNKDKSSERVVSLDKNNDKGEGCIKISITNQIVGGKNIINSPGDDDNVNKNILNNEKNLISNETSDESGSNNDIVNKDKKSGVNSPSLIKKQTDDNKNVDDEEREEGEVEEDEDEEGENEIEKIKVEEKSKNLVVLNDKLEKTDKLNVIIENKTGDNNLLTNESCNDKLIDYGEVIDLDDYPDDLENEINNPSPSKSDAIKTSDNNCQETWASRYYQTDNVQSVIKESKIQSEIRKRLRERQKLSKLSNSPKNNVELNDKVNDNVEKFKPTGSVKEYLAIKNSINSDSNLNLMKDHDNNLKIDEGSFDEKVVVSTQQSSDSLQQPSTSINDNVS